MRGVAKFAVTDSFQVPDGASSVSTKLAFELDLNGLVRCTAATHHCKVETVEAPAPPAAEAAKAGDKPDAASVGDTVMTEEAEDGGSAPGEVATSEKGENGDASNMETDAPPKAQKQTKKVKKVCAFLMSTVQNVRASRTGTARQGVVQEAHKGVRHLLKNSWARLNTWTPWEEGSCAW